MLMREFRALATKVAKANVRLIDTAALLCLALWTEGTPGLSGGQNGGCFSRAQRNADRVNDRAQGCRDSRVEPRTMRDLRSRYCVPTNREDDESSGGSASKLLSAPSIANLLCTTLYRYIMAIFQEATSKIQDTFIITKVLKPAEISACEQTHLLKDNALNLLRARIQ